MPYYNLDHLDAVTRLIADLGISVDDDGHVGDDGSTYYGGFIQKGGETLSFTVRQPQGAGKPDAVEAMRQLVEEACLADRGIDTLAGERGITKPSQAVYRFDRAKQALDFLNDRCYLGRSDLLELHSTLGDHLDAVRKGVAAEAAERAEEQERTHPKVPEGFVTIESLQDDLDTGDWGDQCTKYDSDSVNQRFADVAEGGVDLYTYNLLKWLPDHYEWMETASEENRLEGLGGDLPRMIQAAQEVCYRHELEDHRADICKHVTLESLKDAGVYAVSEELAESLDCLAYSREDSFDSLYMSAQNEIEGALTDALADALGGEEPAGEAADLLVQNDSYDTVNPCALSVEAVHAVNEKGYEAAFAECGFWKSYARGRAEPERLSLDALDRQCRAAGAALEQDGTGHEPEPSR